MNWEAIGAIGESIGAVAVLVTLIYLALQLKNYQQGISSSVLQSSIAEFNRLNTMMADQPELANLIERGMADPDSLNQEEEIRYIWMSRSYANAYLSLYYQYLNGSCPKEYWLLIAQEYRQNLKRPGFIAFRERNRTYEPLLRYLETLPEVGDAGYSFGLNESR